MHSALDGPRLAMQPRSTGGTHQFHEKLSLVPSRLLSPLAALCLSLYATRSCSVKPSCAMMKLMHWSGRLQTGTAGDSQARPTMPSVHPDRQGESVFA